jgi:hypothetical protein
MTMKEYVKTIMWNLALISVGSVICTLAINGILTGNRNGKGK